MVGGKTREMDKEAETMGKVEAMGKHCRPVLQGALSPVGNLMALNDIRKKGGRHGQSCLSEIAC